MQCSKNTNHLGRESFRDTLLSVFFADFFEIPGQVHLMLTTSRLYREASPNDATKDFSIKEGNDKAEFIVESKHMNKRGN